MLQTLTRDPDHCPTDLCYDTEWLSVLGVNFLNVTYQRAIQLIEELILNRNDHDAASAFFVNAHTLNLATEDPEFRETLNRSRFGVW